MTHRLTPCIVALLLSSLAGAAVADTLLDTARIEKLVGAKGKLAEGEGVFKVSVPRSDLAVTVRGTIKLTPPLRLTSWAAFSRAGDHAMVMGDEEPRVLFMHIGGTGKEADLARAVQRRRSVALTAVRHRW